MEYRVKAAFLYNFAQFVEWPHETDEPVYFCILGGDPFGQTLEATTEGKHVRGRPILIRRLKGVEHARDCELLFFSSTENKRLADNLTWLKGRSVLTVGDSPRFARSGGMINFVVEQGKVRFEINREAANRAGLKLSSKLLGLARIVEDAEVVSR